MKLSTFIRDNIELILQQWEHFAREVQPENRDLDREALRDHAKLIKILMCRKTSFSKKRKPEDEN